MKAIIGLGLAGAVAASLGNVKVTHTDDHTEVNFLDQKTHTTGYVTKATYGASDTECTGTPYLVEFFAVGECVVNDDDATSVLIESIADTQFSGYWGVIQTDYSGTTCDSTAITGVASEFSLVQRSCLDSVTTGWVPEIPTADDLAAWYGAGVLTTTHYDSTECAWNSPAPYAEFRSNKCSTNNHWSSGVANFETPIFCAEFGGSQAPHKYADVHSHRIAYGTGSNLCSADPDASATFVYDCDASFDDFYSAKFDKFFRRTCVNAEEFSDEFVVNFQDVGVTNATDFVIIEQFSDSVDGSCNGEVTSRSYYHAGICLPTSVGYVKFRDVKYDEERVHFNVSTYSDWRCTEPDVTALFDDNCTIHNEYCGISPVIGKCASLTVDNLEFGVSYDAWKEFPVGARTEDVVAFKYFPTEESCRGQDTNRVLSADVINTGVCTSFPSAISFTGYEVPSIKGLSVIVESFDDSFYWYSVYNSSICDVNYKLDTVYQPKQSCSLTPKGYVQVMTYEGTGKPNQPNAAIYSLLLLLILGPVFFFVGVQIYRALGCGQKASVDEPAGDDGEIELSNQA